MKKDFFKEYLDSLEKSYEKDRTEANRKKLESAQKYIERLKRNEDMSGKPLMKKVNGVETEIDVYEEFNKIPWNLIGLTEGNFNITADDIIRARQVENIVLYGKNNMPITIKNYFKLESTAKGNTTGQDCFFSSEENIILQVYKNNSDGYNFKTITVAPATFSEKSIKTYAGTQISPEIMRNLFMYGIGIKYHVAMDEVGEIKERYLLWLDEKTQEIKAVTAKEARAKFFDESGNLKPSYQTAENSVYQFTMTQDQMKEVLRSGKVELHVTKVATKSDGSKEAESKEMTFAIDPRGKNLVRPLFLTQAYKNSKEYKEYKEKQENLKKGVSETAAQSVSSAPEKNVTAPAEAPAQTAKHSIR